MNSMVKCMLVVVLGAALVSAATREELDEYFKDIPELEFGQDYLDDCEEGYEAIGRMLDRMDWSKGLFSCFDFKPKLPKLEKQFQAIDEFLAADPNVPAFSGLPEKAAKLRAENAATIAKRLHELRDLAESCDLASRTKLAEIYRFTDIDSRPYIAKFDALDEFVKENLGVHLAHCKATSTQTSN